MSRNKTIRSRADQIRPAGLFQGFPHQLMVLRLEELEQSALELPLPLPFGDINGLTSRGVQARVVHARCQIERTGDEVLHLFRRPRFVSEKGQVDHRVQIAARMSGDEVWNQVLVLSFLTGYLREPARKRLVIVGAGFFIRCNTLGSVCSGATFRWPPT